MTDEQKNIISFREQSKNYPSVLKTTPAAPVLRGLHAE